MKKRVYLVKKSAALFVLKAIDTLLNLARLCGWLRVPTPRHSPPRKILLCNLAHIGDVVLATSVLPVIRNVYPETQIGFLTGSWSKGLLENHACVHQIHYLDHWKLNRGSLSLYKKIFLYLFQRSRMIKELRNADYDLAIDLYPFFPNAAQLLYKAKIPMRVGYTSAGFGALLTHPLDWVEESKSMVEYHRALLIRAGLPSTVPLPPFLAYTQEDPSTPTLPAQYYVFHMGAGREKKSWSKQKWRALLEKVVSLGHFVVFTGQGAGELAAIEETIQNCPQAKNLCNALNLRGFIDIIKGAELVVSVDSAAGHIASAYRVPTVVLFAGLNDPAQWRPQNPLAICLSKPLSCVPCLNRLGCPSVKCIQDIDVDEVIEAAKKVVTRA